jgi:hypothetical protein
MLTPAQVATLRDKAGQVTDSLVDFLITDIAERISEAGQFTNTAAYEAWRAQKLGLSQKELKKELQKQLKLSTTEINQLFTQVAQTSYSNDIKRLGTSGIPFEENTSLQQILDSSVKLAQDDFTNITQTMGFVGPDGRFHELTEAYQRSCDFAFEKVVNGAQDYNSAVRDATRELAKRGIRVMDYDSGVHTSMEAAVRRNIMGGLGLMNERIAQQNHDVLGCDGWEISAHGGCAPDHEPIQGKQYSDAEYSRLNNSLVRRIGTLNCGHSAMPIILGVNEPQYTKEELEEFRKQNEEGITYNGKHYTLYEATQRQSNLETAIRNRKRRILIDEKLGDKDVLQHDQIRLQLLKQEYGRFSKAANLPMRHERMEVAGFNWKKGKAAENLVEKKFQEVLEKAQKGDKIDLDEDMERVIAGKPFEQILPLRMKLSNRAARRWYLAQDATIPFEIDRTADLETQARQACDLRNKNRTNARELMRDQRKRRQLDRDEPNKSFEELIADKMKRKGLTREQAMKDILGSVTKTRKSVNKQLGLE